LIDYLIVECPCTEHGAEHEYQISLTGIPGLRVDERVQAFYFKCRVTNHDCVAEIDLNENEPKLVKSYCTHLNCQKALAKNALAAGAEEDQLPKKVAELPTEERNFYSGLAAELIKSSIARIEGNSSNTLSIVTLIGTLYGAIVSFFVVTSQNVLTPFGAILLAIPEILLIGSALFIALTIVPMNLKRVSILSPGLTYQTYSSIVESKSRKMKISFGLLIAALVVILIVMLFLFGGRDMVLQKVGSS
jgi:hypothetical protein